MLRFNHSYSRQPHTLPKILNYNQNKLLKKNKEKMQKLTFNLLPSTIEIVMKQQHENIFKKLEEGRTWRSLMYQLSVIINIFIFVCEHTLGYFIYFFQISL